MDGPSPSSSAFEQEVIAVRARLHEVSNQMHAATVRVEVTAMRLDGEVNKLERVIAQLDRIERTVGVLEQAKANLDGRLLVLAGGISIVVSIVLWALSRFMGNSP